MCFFALLEILTATLSLVFKFYLLFNYEKIKFNSNNRGGFFILL